MTVKIGEDIAKNITGNLTSNVSQVLSPIHTNKAHSFSSTKVMIEMAFHCVIFIFGTLGNVLVAFVILFNKSLRCTTNWLVLNLAIADLGITLFNIPMTNIYHFTGWPFGENLCKYFLGAFGECIVGVSVFTHTSLALIRYHVVVNPMRCTIHLWHVQLGILVIWLLAYAFLSAPLTGKFELAYSRIINDYVCKPAWPSFEYRILYRSCVFIVTYVIPMVVATYCYVKIYNALKTSINFFRKGNAVNATQMLRREYRSKRLTKALFILYILFSITTLPLEVFYVLIDSGALPTSVYFAHVWSLLVALFYSLSVVNPFMLFYISEEYRNQLLNMFRFCLFWRRSRLNASEKMAAKPAKTDLSHTMTRTSRTDAKKCEGETVHLQILKPASNGAGEKQNSENEETQSLCKK
eukprot:gene9594-17352_t